MATGLTDDQRARLRELYQNYTTSNQQLITHYVENIHQALSLSTRRQLIMTSDHLRDHMRLKDMMRNIIRILNDYVMPPLTEYEENPHHTAHFFEEPSQQWNEYASLTNRKFTFVSKGRYHKMEFIMRRDRNTLRLYYKVGPTEEPDSSDTDDDPDAVARPPMRGMPPRVLAQLHERLSLLEARCMHVI